MAEAEHVANNAPAPRVFISYTHEGTDHDAWVMTLATDLRRNGVDTILDRWELTHGDDITLFMEQGIRSADRVLLVCTPSYASKANEGQGGVGYERMVVTGEIAKDIDTNKFVCVLRDGDPKSSIPAFAQTRFYADFRDDTLYSSALDVLLRDLHNSPAIPKPVLGPNPYASKDTPEVASSNLLPNKQDLVPASDPIEVCGKAEVLLRQKDILGWKRLSRWTCWSGDRLRNGSETALRAAS